MDIARRVEARYSQMRAMDAADERLDEIWNDFAYALPRGLKLPKPKEHQNYGSGEFTLSREVEIALDSDRDVMLFLSCSITAGEDADEDGPYGYQHERVSYWMNAEPWSQEGDSEPDQQAVQEFKRDVKRWQDEIEKRYPTVSKNW